VALEEAGRLHFEEVPRTVDDSGVAGVRGRHHNFDQQVGQAAEVGEGRHNVDQEGGLRDPVVEAGAGHRNFDLGRPAPGVGEGHHNFDQRAGQGDQAERHSVGLEEPFLDWVALVAHVLAGWALLDALRVDSDC